MIWISIHICFLDISAMHVPSYFLLGLGNAYFVPLHRERHQLGFGDSPVDPGRVALGPHGCRFCETASAG